MLALVVAACVALETVPPALPAGITAIAGHGGLTAGLDASGALVALRWPTPGGSNLMHATGQPGAIIGGRWGIEINGNSRWAGDSRARSRQEVIAQGLVETITEWPDGLRVTQRAGVLPMDDVFVNEIQISGARSKPRLTWLAAFAPAIHQMPEGASWAESIDSARTFAAFVDREHGRVWNFRPSRPSSGDWAAARDLARVDATAAAWSEFNDGVWMVLLSSDPVRNAAVAASVREVVAAIASQATVLNSIVGHAISAIEPVVSGGADVYHASVSIRIGKNYQAVAAAVPQSDLTVFGADSQMSEVTSGWSELSVTSAKSAARHWTVLRSLSDPESGFSVRSVGTAQAQDWPREGVLVVYAAALAGAAGTEKSLDAYLRLVRTEDRARKPYGSMPESVYTDGTLASPHFVVDDRGPARTLWVAEQWIRDRAPDARAAWVKEHWASIEAAAEFLSTWFDSRRGAPLWCGDPLDLSDAQTQDRLFAAHAGMSAAIRLAAYAGEAVPETWTARQARLLELTEWVLATPGKWQVGEALVLEMSGLSDEALDPFYASTLGRLENPIGLSIRHLAALLLESALLHRHAPEHFALPADRVRDEILNRIGDTTAIEYPGVDSFVSAQVLIAIALMYSDGA